VKAGLRGICKLCLNLYQCLNLLAGRGYGRISTLHWFAPLSVVWQSLRHQSVTAPRSRFLRRDVQARVLFPLVGVRGDEMDFPRPSLQASFGDRLPVAIEFGRGPRHKILPIPREKSLVASYLTIGPLPSKTTSYPSYWTPPSEKRKALRPLAIRFAPT
jgi:hypothetical protein